MVPAVILESEIDTLVQKCEDVKILILGEVHGIRENVRVLEKCMLGFLSSNHSRIILAFEWPLSDTEVGALNDYIHGKTTVFPIFNFFQDSDGRFTNEHITFFNNIAQSGYKDRVTVSVFDVPTGIEDWEESAAHTILHISNAESNAIVIVEAGVMHARKKKYIDHTGKEVNPMGARLCESTSTISVFLRYESGEVIVEGETHSITDAASQINGPGDAFDYELVIDGATPSM